MKRTEFFETWRSLDEGGMDRAVAAVRSAGQDSVLAALESIPVSSAGFLALISDAADPVMDRIETAAHDLTIKRFGHTVNLYKPLYLSNFCVNNCLYCWFRKDQRAERKILDMDEVRREAAALRDEGYKSVLLVAGEDPKKVSVDYLAGCVAAMKEQGFVFVGIEAEPMSEDDYRTLAHAGLDSVTIYQETYDRKIYEQVHPSGPKRDFQWRINTADRAARAGIRSVGLGALLGLGDFTSEAIALATHAKHMQKNHWQTMTGVSFPRIHAHPDGFAPRHEVNDAKLVRLIMAMRLAFPDSVLTLSTRENAKLRDRLFGVGINQISAGSKTSPGAYTGGGVEAGRQFPVADERAPAQVVEALREKGLEWVWKDWDVNLKAVT